MESRTFQISVRMAFVALIAGYYLAVSRLCTLGFALMDKPYGGWDEYESGTYDGTWESDVFHPKPTFWHLVTDTGNWVFGHLIGLLISIVLVLLAAGIICLIDWIINGPSKYVDPCGDHESCPCPRHPVEKRQAEEAAEAARFAMVAATSAAIAAAISSS